MATPRVASEQRRGFVIERPIIVASGNGRVREEDAARFLGCSPRTLRKMRSIDEGPDYSLVFGRVWYSITDLEAYLELCQHETRR
jgi:hypothetical protein